MTPRQSSLAAASFVYIISNKSHRTYVGIATDLLKRVHEHKTGAYQNGFTARYHFDRLVYYESAADRAAAAKREKQIKAWRREKKVALIQGLNPNWRDLTPDLAAILG